MRTTGWVLFITSLGMMCGLLSVDVAKFHNWNEALEPGFVAIVMAHFATMVTAFTGGKMIPEDRPIDMRTRAQDKVDEAKTAHDKDDSNK